MQKGLILKKQTNMAFCSTRNLIKKLEKRPYTRDFLNKKFEFDNQQGRIKMITEGEDTGETCSLPWVCVTSQSNSTPVRSVLDPSRPLQIRDPPQGSGDDSVCTKNQKLTLNHLLPTGTARLPQIRYLHLVQDLTLTAVTDIEDAYMRIYLEDEGARKITFFAYKTKDGCPTFSSRESSDGKLHKFAYNSCRYGILDSPLAYQISLEKSSFDYVENNTLSVQEEGVIDSVKETLTSLSYADDINYKISLRDVIRFLEVTKQDHTLQRLKKAEMTEFLSLYKGLAEHCLLTGMTLLLQILHFASFSVKKINCVDQILEQKLKLAPNFWKLIL